MMASERAKRLEEIRERKCPGGKCSRCDEWAEDCGCLASDVEWLLSELAVAERVIQIAKENRLTPLNDGDAIYPTCKDKYDRMIAAIEAYNRGER